MNPQKTGLMYSDDFGRYDAGKGYLVFPAGTVPFMADNDYYETPERVTQAYEMLEKTGLLAKLEMIKPRGRLRARGLSLAGLHRQA